jgi:diguanylate cyclase (GGDEF)-like protein
MNRKELNLALEIDGPDNIFALAVGNSSDSDTHPFITTNRVFAAVFPTIRNLSQLLAFAENEDNEKTIIKYNDGYWDLLRLKINRAEILYLLKNISYEKLVLAQVKKQLRELADTHTFYSEILEKELPIGVLIIDDSFNVSYANYTLKRFFQIPAKVRLQKCYNYVKEIRPCSDCILKNIRVDKQKNKKTFSPGQDNRLITAEIHPVGEQHIIIFRDTTREITLIKEIKKQQAELENANRMIAAQNDILKRLSTINIRIGQMRDLDAILETLTQAILGTFSCEKGAILLFNETGKIKSAHFCTDIDETERDWIIKSIDVSLEKSGRGSDANPVESADNSGFEKISRKLSGYITQNMFHKDKLFGRIFMNQPGKNIDQTILELFLNQVSVYLESLELQGRLEAVAQTDSLTGVFNRYYFDRQFKEEMQSSRRFGQPLSLILIDVNGLKAVNDADGHEAGDLLLKETAQLLRQQISSFDFIYRVGGDEFIILLSNCPSNHLKIMVNLLKEVQSEASFLYRGKEIPIRFCLGGACSTLVGYGELKEEADRQMYQDKETYYKVHQRYR